MTTPTTCGFAKVSDVHVRCLAWTAQGLWACGDDALDGFALGLSTDDGKTFGPRLRLAELQPLACVREACGKAWTDVSARIAPPKPDAGVAADAVVPDDRSWSAGGGCAFGHERASRGWMLLLFASCSCRRPRARRR